MASIMTKKPSDAAKLYQEVLKAQHYEQGENVCTILLFDMLLRTKKTETAVIINQDSFNKLVALISKSAKDYEELYKDLFNEHTT